MKETGEGNGHGDKGNIVGGVWKTDIKGKTKMTEKAQTLQ